MKGSRHSYYLEESLAHLSARVYRAMWKHVSRSLTSLGLEITVEQWPILLHLWDQSGQSQRDLAERLFKDKTTIARAVAGLESVGMIEKESSPGDGREKIVFLTEKGRKIMNKATAAVQKVDARLEAGIDPEAMAACKEVLRKAHRNLRG